MNLSLADAWRQALGRLEPRLPKQSFDTWLRPTKPVALYDDTLLVGVPSDFARQYLETRYGPELRRILSELWERNINLRFIIPDGLEQPAMDDPPAPEPKPRAASPAPVLNPRYTFDTFVVGNSNRLAHAAAEAVAANPARAYNPLFIYGGVGLGKTHLMHAIGHAALRHAPRLRILYVSAETFTNELINSIRDDKTAEFRNRYRNIDVLLIDDIQFLSGKERTQEEFFHTFEALHSASRQIVISSDRPPKDIPTLEERLRSRFEWGLITDIQPPDLETRIAILRKKAQLEQLEVPDEVIAFIAARIETNIRELEGALIRLVAYTSLHRIPPTPALAAEILKDLLPPARVRQITIPLIQEAVARHFSLRVEDLTAKRRSRAVAYPRQIAMYLARELTDASLPRIGEAFGGRDHTTVLHACEKIQADLAVDPELRATIEQLVATLRSPSSGQPPA